MWATLLKGAMISGSLIIAIGGQNAFVLKQGLLKQHIFWVALICFACDLLLISVGVYGMGGVISGNAGWSMALAVLGGLFLFGYGWRSFRSAWAQQHSALTTDTQSTIGSLSKTVLATLAVTLLNPHVYLDTVVLIGSLAASVPHGDKVWFLLGATGVSFVWFFGLAYGARLLRPVFANPRAWQILEGGIGVMMWWLSWGLFAFAYQQFQGTPI